MRGVLLSVCLLAGLPAQAHNEVHLERALKLPNGSCGTDLDVELYLTVLDGEGQAIRNLGREDFQLVVDSQVAGPNVLVNDVKLATLQPISIAFVSRLADALGALARRTGGVARTCRDASDLPRQLRSIRDELRHQYVMHVTFALFGSSARSVQVLLRGRTYSNTINVDRALPTSR